MQNGRIKVAALLTLAALAGCASELPTLQTGVQCMKHGHGKATVTATGVEVDEGRCTEWRVGPSQRAIDAWNARHPSK